MSTLCPRDYTKYTVRVYGPDPISGPYVHNRIRKGTDRYPTGGGLSEEQTTQCVSLVLKLQYCTCMYVEMDKQQQSRLFAELELRDVEETGRKLGTGAYGIVTEVNVKGLK